MAIGAGMLCLLFGTAGAENTQAEIQYLLNVVGESGCTFIRNGKEHDSADAESHMAMKYGRGKRWVNSAEQFIERIATQSSFSGKPYFIQCADQVPRPTGEWLAEQLDRHRNPTG